MVLAGQENIVCNDASRKFFTESPLQDKDLIEYEDDLSTPTVDITTTNVLINSVLSTPNGKFMTLDVKDFYLNTDLDVWEYMKMDINILPEEVIKEYNLRDIVDDNGYVYMQIRKGMYD